MSRVVILEVFFLAFRESIVLLSEVVPLFSQHIHWIFQRLVVHQTVEDFWPDSALKMTRNGQRSH